MRAFRLPKPAASAHVSRRAGLPACLGVDVFIVTRVLAISRAEKSGLWLRMKTRTRSVKRIAVLGWVHPSSESSHAARTRRQQPACVPISWLVEVDTSNSDSHPLPASQAVSP
jgi:hypothetical protein